ncbi:Uncharacterised protein [Candidatus Norongarragalina meridionalis]|nr:Uncharacterised protein [Candidatus Norongarragalina meridionalis]
MNELRFLIHDFDAFRRKARNNGFAERAGVTFTDYYLSPRLRVRVCGKKAKLIYSDKKGKRVLMESKEFIPDAPAFVVKKERSFVFSKGNASFCVERIRCGKRVFWSGECEDGAAARAAKTFGAKLIKKSVAEIISC